ncbi:hypothetical protein MHN81_22510 [Pseudoalteromonas sp. Of7M-16]|nr:hypothetical protein [Pseudoalteromonas sp. Of7M-16]
MKVIDQRQSDVQTHNLSSAKVMQCRKCHLFIRCYFCSPKPSLKQAYWRWLFIAQPFPVKLNDTIISNKHEFTHEDNAT